MGSNVRFAGALVLGTLAAAATGTVVAVSGTSDAASGPVVAMVVDGDTLALRDGRRIRLVQVDTPELGTGECYSRAARTALLALTPVGSTVTLDADPSLDRVDRYGRLLRYVRRNGVNVNLELVRHGAAAPYFYRGERGRYAETLMAAAVAARAAGRGLWGACPRTPLDPAHAIDTGRSGQGSAPPSATVPTSPTPATPAAGCDPNYAGGCVPPYPPDVDCKDIRALGIAPVRVIGSDPHRLDGDRDGWGCD